MIDKRQTKANDFEIDEDLQQVTDTSILLNFQKAIVSLYPNLIPIRAYAYHSWDDIIMPLFFEMVYKTFAYKYGIDIEPEESHPYMFSLRCYKGINHIECIPKKSSFNAFVNNEWIEMDKSSLEENALVFKSFGDGIHSLSFGLDVKEAHKMSFDLVEVDVVSASTGYSSKTSIYIKKDNLDFEFVAETYDKDLQQ